MILATLTACSGATCVPRAPLSSPPAPVAFASPPSREELVAALNANAYQVRTLHTDNASLSAPGMPGGLRATISLQPPRRLRLRARLLGPEIDLGSNEQLVWLWIGSDPQRAVYSARHDQLAVSSGATPFPLDTTWLMQAFGLVELSPQDRHDGPFLRSDGKLELRSQLARPGGPLTQSLIIDSTYGWVTHQTLWDGNGRVIALTQASGHHYYPEANVSLPHRIEIELPPAGLSLQLDVGTYVVNQPLGDPQELWQMPPLEGYQHVDLATLAPGFPPPAEAIPTAWRHVPEYSDHDRTAFRPRFRGYSESR